MTCSQSRARGCEGRSCECVVVCVMCTAVQGFCADVHSLHSLNTHILALMPHRFQKLKAHANKVADPILKASAGGKGVML